MILSEKAFGHIFLPRFPSFVETMSHTSLPTTSSGGFTLSFTFGGGVEVTLVAGNHPYGASTYTLRSVCCGEAMFKADGTLRPVPPLGKPDHLEAFIPLHGITPFCPKCFYTSHAPKPATARVGDHELIEKWAEVSFPTTSPLEVNRRASEVALFLDILQEHWLQSWSALPPDSENAAWLSRLREELGEDPAKRLGVR